MQADRPLGLSSVTALHLQLKRRAVYQTWAHQSSKSQNHLLIINLSLAPPASRALTAFWGSSVASSSGSGGESHSISENNGNMDIDSQKSNPAPLSLSMTLPRVVSSPKAPFDALPEELKVSTVPPNGNNKFGFSNYCLCCGL